LFSFFERPCGAIRFSIRRKTVPNSGDQRIGLRDWTIECVRRWLRIGNLTTYLTTPVIYQIETERNICIRRKKQWAL
jgi:hypothetical protein